MLHVIILMSDLSCQLVAVCLAWAMFHIQPMFALNTAAQGSKLQHSRHVRNMFALNNAAQSSKLQHILLSSMGQVYACTT